MPIIIELIGRFVENSKLKFVISLMLPLLAGTALNWDSINIYDAEAILGSGAVIFAAAQGVYKLYFKDSQLQARLSNQ